MVNLIPTKEEWNRALSERHGEDVQKKFSSATVAVCGLGGLGSNIAISLARAGIPYIISPTAIYHFTLRLRRFYAIMSVANSIVAFLKGLIKATI